MAAAHRQLSVPPPMTRGLALAFAVALGGVSLLGCGEDEPRVSPLPRAVAARAPALKSIQAQGNRLLGGGADAFKRRLAALRGYPVVVNQWASWCPPCRREFPYFQRLAARYGDRVAFLGVDSSDNRDAAERFMQRFPTPYPHYFDPDNEIARVFEGGRAWPTTAFYDRRGRLRSTRPGGYAKQADLRDDIRRYALGG